MFFFDALRVKIKENGRILNKAVHLVLGITMEGNKDLLGVWIAKEEGAKFWLRVLNDLKTRGVQDIFITCVDGLKGFPDAVESVFPQSEVQLCVVHQVRNSLKFVSWKERKEVAGDLKTIYGAATVEEAEMNLLTFTEKWDEKYPSISLSWQRNWENLSTFFAYPPEIRRAIYTTNSIESVNRSLRKVIKNRGSFPNDDSALKLIYLAIQNISAKWTKPIHHWKEALNQFSILCAGRMPED